MADNAENNQRRAVCKCKAMKEQPDELKQEIREFSQNDSMEFKHKQKVLSMRLKQAQIQQKLWLAKEEQIKLEITVSNFQQRLKKLQICNEFYHGQITAIENSIAAAEETHTEWFA